MENKFVYYNKTTGKVLSDEEAKAEWEQASRENRPSNMALASVNNLVIEDGYVKEKIRHTVAELIDKSKEEKERTVQTVPLEALIPETPPVQSGTKSKDDIINEIIEEAKSYPTPTEQYSVDDIVDEFSSKKDPKYFDKTQEFLTPRDTMELFTAPSATPLEETAEDIDNPDYALKVLRTAQVRSYASNYERILNSSVSKRTATQTEPAYERSGKRKGIKYGALTKSLVAVASVAILISAGNQFAKGVEALTNEMDYSSSVNVLSTEYNDDINFVNKNKITIEGSFDSYGHPAFWIDTQRVAQDILDMPDESYIGSLYMAYSQMGNDRANGPYNNWDDTIYYIGSNVDETHPKAYATTFGCANFKDFLVKAGYVDPETNEPSVELFEKAGRQAVIDFATYTQDEDPDRGGRI